MLHSLTDLLTQIQVDSSEEPFVLKNPVYEQTHRRHFEDLDYKRLGALRFACTQGYFLRLPQRDKLRYLHECVDSIDSVRALTLLVNTLAEDIHGKLIATGKATVGTNFPYYQAYEDDHRTLHPKMAKRVRGETLAWFKVLPAAEQVSSLIGFLRLAGGRLIPAVVVRLVERRKQLLAEREVLEAAEDKRSHSAGSPSKDSRMRIFSVSQDMFLKMNPEDASTLEVIKLRKNWDEMVNKYRVEVEGKKGGEKKKKKKKKKGGKGSKKSKKSGKSKKKGKSATKSSKSTKSTKSKGSKKSKKGKKSKKRKGKGKKKKKGRVEEVDMIQLLPIWIAKQIFSYLDKKTLQKIKKVNAYWSFVVTDLLKEMSARKTLDKTIKKMQDDLFKNGGTFDQIKPVIPSAQMTARERRMYKLQLAGCTIKKLRVPFKHEYIMSLFSRAPKEFSNDYVLPVEQLSVFPRNFVHHSRLLRKPSLIFLDRDFYLGTKSHKQRRDSDKLEEDENDFIETDPEVTNVSLKSLKSFLI